MIVLKAVNINEDFFNTNKIRCDLLFDHVHDTIQIN